MIYWAISGFVLMLVFAFLAGYYQSKWLRAKKILPRVAETLELAMDISMRYEPCGYYCGDGVGHVDHKLYNWAREDRGEITELLGR